MSTIPASLTSSVAAQRALQASLGSSPPTANVGVLLRTFAPLPPTLSLTLAKTTSLASILTFLSNSLNLSRRTASLLRLTTPSGQLLSHSTTLATLHSSSNQSDACPLHLHVRLTLKGGKGGFASMLRAQGGKMNAKGKDQNTGSCRDLNGRRLSTMKQAKELAAYLAQAPAREAALSEAQAKKYAKLEKMLGRRPKNEADFIEAATKLNEHDEDFQDGSASPPPHATEAEGSRAPAKRDRQAALKKSEVPGGKRVKVDHEFVEESREIVQGVRSAVASAMLKKKRKAALAAAKAKTSVTSSTTTTTAPV